MLDTPATAAAMLDTTSINNKKCVAVLVHLHAQQAREAAAVMLFRYFSTQRLDILVPVKLDILQAREAAAYTSRAASVFVLLYSYSN